MEGNRGGLILTKQKKTKDYFSTRMFFRALPPSLISYIGLAFGDIADAVVVGQRVGVSGLAAISLALPVYMLINVIMHGFGTGGSIVYARLLGEGKKKEAIANFNGVFRTSVFIGLFLSLLGNLYLDPLLKVLGIEAADGLVFEVSRQYIRMIVRGIPLFFTAYLFNYYLRSDGLEREAGLGFTVANISDIVLNVIFVLVLDMGATGAALSTLAGQVIAILFYLPSIFNGKNILSFSKERSSLKDCLHCFKIGVSSSIQYLFLLIFILLTNNILMKSGGEVAVAIFDVIQNTSFLMLYLYEGTAKAAQALISTYCGERNREGRKRILSLTILWGTSLGLIACISAALFPEVLCILFGLNEPEAMAAAIPALRIYCLSVPLAGLNVLLESYFQAAEREKKAFVIALLRGALVLIPCTFFLSYFGWVQIWYLFVITEGLSLALFLLGERMGEGNESTDESRLFFSTISNGNDDMENLLKEMDEFCDRWNAEPKQTYFVRMTLEELCVVILKKLEHHPYGYIQITLIALEDGGFELHIRDNAVSFNPFELHTAKVNTRQYDMEAMGMLMVKSRAKEMFYRQYQGFNTVVVRI